MGDPAARLVAYESDEILSMEPLALQSEQGRAPIEHFLDGREGKDRWGRERKGLWACGTGWGDDGYVCPAYAEEACPGDGKNPGDRMEPMRTFTCDMLCGACGGGGRTETIAYCGWTRGADMFADVVAEMGGSLRLDKIEVGGPPPRAAEPWGCSYIPSCEHQAKGWMSALTEDYGKTYPAFATSIRTATPGNRHNPTPLATRLGGYDGRVLVHGYAKDDALDDVWEYRDRLIGWCAEQGVDTMITPQFSYYNEDQRCMTIVNLNRTFRWYAECRELGFPNVALDIPPSQGYRGGWLYEEYLAFILKYDVKLLAISYQTFGQGGLGPNHAATLKKWDEDFPEDVSFVVVGANNKVVAMTQMLCPNRQFAYINSDAFAKAAYFRLATDQLAPKGWTKGQAFAWSVRFHNQNFENIIQGGRSGRAQAEPSRSAGAKRRGQSGARRPRQRR